MKSKLSSPKPSSPTRIYYWAKAIGLAPFTLKNKKFYPATLPDKMYQVSIIAFYLILTLTPIVANAELIPEDTSFVQKRTSLLHNILNCGMFFFTISTFLLKREEIISVMNELCLINKEFDDMGVDEDLEKMFKDIFATVVKTNVVVGAMCLLLNLFEPFWSVYISVAMTIRECVRLNVFLTFGQVLLCIGRRFRLLNEKMYDVFQRVDQLVPSSDNLVLVTSKDPGERVRENQFRKIEILHLELYELVDRTTQLFAAPFLLNILTFCSELVLSSYWIYHTLLNLHHHDGPKNVWHIAANIFCPTLRMVIVAIQSIIIAYAAATTCQQGNATKFTLFKVWNKFAPTELIDEDTGDVVNSPDPHYQCTNPKNLRIPSRLRNLKMKNGVNLTRSQTLLYYFAGFVGLAPFTVGTDASLRPAGSLRKFWALILALSSSAWILATFIHSNVRIAYINSWNKFIFVIGVLLLLANVYSGLLTFVFKSRKIVDTMNRIAAIKDDLKNMGTRDNCGMNCGKFYGKIISTNAVIILVKIITDTIGIDDEMSAVIQVLSTLGSTVIAVHCHNVILIFVQTMICVRGLFKSLNDKLQGTVRPKARLFPPRDLRNSSIFTIGKKQRVRDRPPRRIIPESEDIQLSVEDVEKLEQLHGELCDLVESVTRTFTVPILLAIFRHFTLLLLNCYSLYMYLNASRRSDDTRDIGVQFALCLIGWTSITILELFLIANACASVCRTGNATKTTLHKVWNKFYPEELKDEFFMFSLQLLHKPVVVSAFGFFDLDFSFLYKIFCAVVAYVIIIIQLDTSSSNPRT